jgi:hypothetical protein
MPAHGIAIIYTLRRFFFMRRITPVEPAEPVKPAEPLSHVIKGHLSPRANPKPKRAADKPLPLFHAIWISYFFSSSMG